jgi:zinc transport system substrate-binding protein
MRKMIFRAANTFTGGAFCFLLFSILLFSCSVNSGRPEGQNSGKITVVTTIFPPYDFVRAIAGDKAQTTMLLKPGSESHSYEPTPQDMITINRCDLLI